MTEGIVKSPVENQGVSRYYLRNKSGNFNGHIIDPGDMTVLSDSVLHMARAIIADTISLRDRKVKIDDGAKVDVPKVSLSKKKENKLSLESLKENFKEKSFEEKASFAELLSKRVKNEYEKIKSDKNVRDCVSNIKTALKRYKNRKTKENAEKVADEQLSLIKVLNKKKYPKYVKEALGKIFMRVAVESFQKEFGDLKRVKTLHDMKLFLNKLYEDIKLNPIIKKYSGECEDSLIYGFGHYPSSSISIDLNELKGNPKIAKNAVWALKSMSLGYPVFSKNGKRFEIFDTGSYNDRNCAFRAVAVGAGFGPNGYNKIQKKVIEGAKKLLDELKEDPGSRSFDINLFLENEDINLPEKNEKCLTEWLNKYISDRGNGFVAGMGDIEYSLAAIGLGRPIYVIDTKDGSEYTYSQYGKKIGEIKHDAKDKTIYISKLQGHAVALLPLRKNSNLFNDSELAQKVEGAVKDSMITIMMEEIQKGKESKLLESMSKYLNFYYDYKDENKKEDNKNLFIAMDMIHKIVKEMSTDEVENIENIERELKNLAKGFTENGKDVKTIELKLEEYLKVISQKAINIYKKEPLFWNNYVQSL